MLGILQLRILVYQLMKNAVIILNLGLTVKEEVLVPQIYSLANLNLNLALFLRKRTFTTNELGSLLLTSFNEDGFRSEVLAKYRNSAWNTQRTRFLRLVFFKENRFWDYKPIDNSSHIHLLYNHFLLNIKKIRFF